MTGNLLVVTFWRANYEFQAVAVAWNFRIDVLPYDHKNLLDGTPALLYKDPINLYAHVKEAEKKFLGNVSIFFIF